MRLASYNVCISGRKSTESIIKEVICRQALRAIKLKRRAMPLVAATLSNQGNLPARGTSLGRIRIGRRHPEFLNRLGVQA